MDDLTHKPFAAALKTFEEEGIAHPELSQLAQPRRPKHSQGKGQRRMHAQNQVRQGPYQPPPRTAEMPFNGIPMVLATPFKRVAAEALMKAAIYTTVAGLGYFLAHKLLKR
jgi:hypothetical protein